MHRPASLGVYKAREPDGAKGVQFSGEVVETIRHVGVPVWSSYGSIYRCQPAVRSIVDFLARNIAQLNPKVYERIGDNDRLELSDHPLARLLRHPNPFTTRFRHLRDTVADMAVYDRAFWEKIGAGRAMIVQRISPPSLQIDNSSGRTVYRYSNGTENRVIPPERLVVFPGYQPDGIGFGVSPLETLRQILLADAQAMTHRAAFWRNAARQGGVVQRPLEAPEWSDPARQRFRADLEAMSTGSANSGRTMVLEEGMSWNASAFSPKDSEYIAGRNLTYEEVSVAYFGPIVGRSFMEATGAGTESNHRQLYQDVLGPWLQMIEDEIELQVLSAYEPFVGSRVGPRVYVEFDLAAKLKGSFEEQSKSLVSSTGVPYMTVNESRSRLNLPKISEAWADTPVQPLNVMYGGQPAVTVPTEVPGEAPRTLQAASAPILALKAAKPALVAPPGVLARRDAVAVAHAELLRRTFARQRGSVGSTVKAAKAVEWERWNRELATDFFALAVPTVRLAGERVARQFAGDFDEIRTYAWLDENAKIAADRINRDTAEALAAGLDVDDVFDANLAKADAVGLSRATVLINWARNEAAKQNPDGDKPRTKTWVVTSANSRHPEWSGLQAEVGQTFGNGAEYPGDVDLGVDEVANCRCVMRLD